MSRQPETANILGFEYLNPISDEDGWGALMSDSSNAPRSLQLPAYYGPVGDIGCLIADSVPYEPCSIVMQLLTAVGAWIGPEPFFQEGPNRLGTNTYLLVLGETGGGKGSSLGWVNHVMRRVDSEFMDDRVVTSLASGEGLISKITDPVMGLDSKGLEVTKVKGSDDKRVLVIESEAGAVFVNIAMNQRYEKQLTSAYDGSPMESVTKSDHFKCARPHVSIIGHMTVDEWLDRLTRAQTSNGFMNRFLVCPIKSVSTNWNMTAPNEIVGLSDAIDRLKKNLEAFAVGPRIFELDDEAEALRVETVEWRHAHQPKGVMRSLTQRHHNHLLKLACTYAAADGTNIVNADHVRAARSVVAYSHRSLACWFGDKWMDERDDFLTLWKTHHQFAPVNLTEIAGMYARNMSAAKRDRLLERLQRDGVIELQQIQNPRGRPRTEIIYTPQAADNTPDW